jgi:hypothetical protein
LFMRAPCTTLVRSIIPENRDSADAPAHEIIIRETLTGAIDRDVVSTASYGLWRQGTNDVGTRGRQDEAGHSTSAFHVLRCRDASRSAAMVLTWSQANAQEPAGAEMVRYYFHLRSGEGWARDNEGSELASADDARREAIRDAREMVARLLMSDAPIPWDNVIEVGTADCKLFEISFREAVGL